VKEGVGNMGPGVADSGAMPVVGIHFNLSETVGLRSLARQQQNIDQSIVRLSTGQKLNKASDDPAGLIGSESLKSDQTQVLAEIKANQRDTERYSAIDGGLSAVGDLLSKLRSDIVVNANTGGLTDTERQANQLDANSIVDALSGLANTTVFDGEQILQPYIGAAATDSSGQNIAGSLAALQAGGKYNLVDGDLEGAQTLVDGLISDVSTSRAGLGANQKRIQAVDDALETKNENLSAAISQIVDTNYATEVGQLVRSQVLEQAATFAVKAAQSLQAQTVLDLIGTPLSAAKTGRAA